ncbi:MAG: hypothetical protein EBS05_27270 [Proteobacteria bacterium]|nr:hypothetical protein [Pseudomonadota bacterium]
MLCQQNQRRIVIALLALLCILALAQGAAARIGAASAPTFEGYGSADEPHAGLNPAATLESTPMGWASIVGVRGDSTAALATKIMRD